MDYAELTAREAVAALRAGDISAEAYAHALIERASAHADLNAFITLDADRVLQAAHAADAERASGVDLGALHGLPVVIKDNIDTADLPTTAGTTPLKDHRPSRNAPVVQALVDAGALILGKTNLHELAFGITNINVDFGPAHNPYDRSRIPGGSSGGTGVAVASRLTPAGLGTDTGGSVRIPSALCGIVGYRPTVGRYSQAGVVPVSHTRDTVGPMARSVADIVLLDGVITGGSTYINPVDLDGLRLGVPRIHFWENLDPAVAALAEAALEKLRENGVVLVDVEVVDLAALDEATSFPVELYEIVIDLPKYLRDSRSGLTFPDLLARIASPDVRDFLSDLLGKKAIPADVYHAALSIHRPALQAAYRTCFAENAVTGLIFPTTPLAATPIDKSDIVVLNGREVSTFSTFARNTGPSSNAGIPGLSLPIGLTDQGLPVGIAIDGPDGRDKALLAIGLAMAPVFGTIPKPNLNV